MTTPPQQFSVIHGPRNGCLFILIVAPLFFGIGGPIIFISERLWGALAAFAAFFAVAILLQWFISRWLVAKTIITTDEMGITIEIVRGGLGIPKGSSFFAWDQLEGFKYSSGGKGSNSITLHWTDSSKITFQANEVYSLYEFLQQVCPEKELHYWFWPPKK